MINNASRLHIKSVLNHPLFFSILVFVLCFQWNLYAKSGGNTNASGAKGQHALVTLQFQRPLTAQERGEIKRLGIRIFRAINNNTYLARGSSTALNQLRSNSLLLSIREVSPVSKLSPGLAKGSVGKHALNPDGTISAIVKFLDGTSLREALHLLDSIGVKVEDRKSFLFNNRLAIIGASSQFARIAASSIVEAIEEVPPPPQPDNATAAQLSNVDDIQAAPFNLNGTNVVMGIWDEGPVRAGHPDLTPRITVNESDQPEGDHSTHVAGTMISSGANNANARGMAPGAGQLFSYDFGDDTTTEQNTAVTDHAIRVSNHSWGSVLGWNFNGTMWLDSGNDGQFGLYNGTARDWDALVRSTGLIVVKSSGNDRDDCNPSDSTDCDGALGGDGQRYDTIGTQGNAKNIITVGAINDDGTTIAGFSSSGPANDGRIKPDVVANGVGLLSTWQGGATIPGGCDGMNYCSIGGTSMSTPVVSGTIATLIERYRQKYAGANPTADVIKALLVNTATDLGRPGPDYLFGFGLINALTAVNTIDVGAVRIITDAVDHGNTDEFVLSVPAGLPDLRITLNWIDPEGVANDAANDIINNLDLEIVGPDSVVRFPFTGPGVNYTNNSTATGPNSIDTVEHFRIASPQQGFWKVRVRGTGVPSGPQNYALVANTSFSLPGQPDIRVSGDLNFDPTCAGESSRSTVSIFNIGGADLQVNSVSVTSGATDFSLLPDPVQPFIVKPGAHVDVVVRFNPSTPGLKSGVLRIVTNDADQGTIDLPMSGSSGSGDIATTLGSDGNFGNVAQGGFKLLTLQVINEGTCDLEVLNVARISGSTDFTVGELPGNAAFPVVLGAASHSEIPIRFQPSSFGPKSVVFRITSDDPDQPAIDFTMTGNSPPSDIRVTGSTEFGEVCFGELQEKTIHICNVGLSDLQVTSVAFDPACEDFEIINNPFPANVSHDFCMPLTIRYTPSSAGSHNCTLKISSNDPDSPEVNLSVTASTPFLGIDSGGDHVFRPTVIQSIGPCSSLRPLVIGNTNLCNVTITSVTITGSDAADYSLSGLPALPMTLEPGHQLGEGDLQLVFKPTILDRDRKATLSISFISDPVVGTVSTVTHNLCGEGVRTGARILVKSGGSPIASVDRLQLLRINANRNKRTMDTVDTVRNLTLQTVSAAAACESFQFHREYGTVSNPVQLLPGDYQLTVTVLVAGKRLTKTYGFHVETCDFNQTITINF